MAGELRAAIAGTGFVGAIHARSARLAGARLAGVAASSEESAAAAASRLGAERSFASAEDMVEAEGVDGDEVVGADAGREGAERLVKAAAEAGRQAAVPFIYRYYPTVREARERVRDGRTGPVRLVHGTYLQDWLLSAEDHNWRVEEELGGASRAFADIGSHWCDLAEFVSGHRIARLSARVATAHPERRRSGAETFA